MSQEIAFEKLGIPRDIPELYSTLGILVPGNDPSQISIEDITNKYNSLKPILASQNHPARERELVERAFRTLSNPDNKTLYDKHVFPASFSTVEAVIAKAKLSAAAATPVIAATTKFSIRNPAVMLGATALAIAGTWVGVNATSRINAKKDEGTSTTASDRAAQAAGFATAVGVISAAALMWNASSKAR